MLKIHKLFKNKILQIHYFFSMRKINVCWFSWRRVLAETVQVFLALSENDLLSSFGSGEEKETSASLHSLYEFICIREISDKSEGTERWSQPRQPALVLSLSTRLLLDLTLCLLFTEFPTDKYSQQFGNITECNLSAGFHLVSGSTLTPSFNLHLFIWVCFRGRDGPVFCLLQALRANPMLQHASCVLLSALPPQDFSVREDAS